ncbi:MAG: metallophosphoesterase [Candidatus Saccharimonadales bacterium]
MLTYQKIPILYRRMTAGLIGALLLGFFSVQSVFAVPPVVTMTSVVVDSPTQVTLTCQTNPNANDGSVFGWYGLGTTYNTKIQEQTFSLTQSTVTTTHTVSGLSPETQYSFRCRVKVGTTGYNSNGQTLTTPASTVPRLDVTESNGATTVAEPATTDTIQVALGKQPVGNVVVNISSSDTSEGVVSPQSLSFSSTNWNVGQTVTVTAVDDAIIDGTVNYTLSVAVDPALSSDEYDSVTPVTVNVTTTDNDVASDEPIILTAVGDLCKDLGSSQTSGAQSCQNTSRQVQAINPTYHIALGDLQYDSGSAAQFAGAYNVSWAAVKNITLPVVGNHEQKDTANPIGYCSYFDPASAPTGFCANGMSYMKNLNSSWAFISMESTGTVSSSQITQLNNFITAAGSRNIVLAFHEPRYSTTCNWSATDKPCHGDGVKKAPYWEIAYDRGVDLILAGHDHKYERFVPMTRTGSVAGDGNNGLVSIVSGMGANTNDPGCDTTRTARTAFCVGDELDSDPLWVNDATVVNGGVLKVVLNANNFTYEFREADNSFNNPTVGIGQLIDSGTGVLRP